jgi:undecaprenyl-diphosphatase
MDRWHLLDVRLLEALNSWAGRYPRFDQIVLMLESNSLVKTGLLVGLLWYAWFRDPATPESPSSERRTATRERVIRTLIAICVATVAARAGELFLPQRLRPIHDPAAQARLAYGLDPRSHAEWNSFPSDHAVLLCALAAGLWGISRWFGLFAFAWSVVIVFAVRVYAGLHYPSDIVGGGIVGLAILWVVVHEQIVTPRLVDWALQLERARPVLFYAAAFLFTWQVGDFFGDIRHALSVLGGVLVR